MKNKFFFFFILVYCLQTVEGLCDPIRTIPSYKDEIRCTSLKCVDLNEVLDATIHNGYVKRATLETVYQARQRILVSMGNLLPRLQFNLGVAIAPTSVLSTLSNLLGFLIPSNWFNWKESILNYEAQKHAFVNILKNQIVDTQTLYYNIHQYEHLLKIYTFYADQTAALIKEMRENNAKIVTEGEVSGGKGKVSEKAILMLETTRAEFIANIDYYYGIISSWYAYDLAVGMAYLPIEDLGIKPIPLPDLTEASKLPMNAEVIASVKSKNSALKSMRYLIMSAHYNRLERIFSFISATGDNGASSAFGISIGLDNFAQITISQSQITQLQIQLKNYISNLESTIRKVVLYHNSSVNLFFDNNIALEKNKLMIESVLSDYNEKGELDINALIWGLHWGVNFELTKNFAYHYELTLRAQYDQLNEIGIYYPQLLELVPLNKTLHWWYDRTLIRENRKIAADIKQEELERVGLGTEAGSASGTTTVTGVAGAGEIKGVVSGNS